MMKRSRTWTLRCPNCGRIVTGRGPMSKNRKLKSKSTWEEVVPKDQLDPGTVQRMELCKEEKKQFRTAKKFAKTRSVNPKMISRIYAQVPPTVVKNSVKDILDLDKQHSPLERNSKKLARKSVHPKK